MGNTLKIKGIKKISGETRALNGYHSGQYLQVNYDRKSGEAWTDFHCSLGQNSWREYSDSNIISCGNLSEPATMAEIREMIERAVAYAV